MQSCPGPNGCLRVFPLLNSAAETVGMRVFLEVSPRDRGDDHPVGRVSHHMLRRVLLAYILSCSPHCGRSHLDPRRGARVFRLLPALPGIPVRRLSDDGRLAWGQAVPPVAFHWRLSGRRCWVG